MVKVNQLLQIIYLFFQNSSRIFHFPKLVLKSVHSPESIIRSTYVGHIVAAVLFFRAAATVLLALLVLEGSIILSELFAVLEHKAERTSLTRVLQFARCARRANTPRA